MNKTFNSDNKRIFMDLFHEIPVTKAEYNTTRTSLSLLEKGIIFIDKNNNVVHNVPYEDANVALDRFGLSNVIWNRAFHTTWEKVSDTPIEQLIFEQVMHYFSTYGRERAGLDACPVYPVENLPNNLSDYVGVKAITVIRYISMEEAIEKIEKYLTVTVAPHRDRVNAIGELMAFTNIAPEKVKSFELKVMRYTQLGTVPQNGEEFLRYLVYTLTGNTVLIKNRNMIQALKSATGDVYGLLAKADQKELAKIFYRYKPLFLALKCHPRCNTYVNKLRRMADEYHVPMSDVNVQNLSKLYREGRNQDANRVLAKCSIRQLIKIHNFAIAEVCRDGQNDVLPVYNIRNGKLYVNKTPKKTTYDKFSSFYAMLMDCRVALARVLYSNLKDKVFYIPNGVEYAAPVSEKQFISNIPYGTKMTVPEGKAVIPAVYWENYHGRTDLDLHLQSMTQAFGWNANYRGDDCEVLYSGDITDATNGAVEAFKIEPREEDRYLLTISNFTEFTGVPFEFFLSERAGEFNRPRRCNGATPICDVKDAMFAPVPLKFSESYSQNLGIFVGRTFYFYGGDLSMSIVPKRELYSDFLRSLENKLRSYLTINEIIALGNNCSVIGDEEYAKLTDEQKAEVIDLSPASLTARSLLDIVDSDVQ